MPETDDRFIAQELRDSLDRRDDLDDFGAYIDHDNLRDVLVHLSVGWSTYSSPSSPDRFEDTELCRTLLRQYGDRRLLDLLDSENNVGLSFLLGEEDSTSTFDNEFPTLEVIDDIRNEGAPYILTLFGKPKRGKTGTAASYVRWAERLYGERQTSVVTNMESFEAVDDVFTSYSELRSILGDSDDLHIVVLDEGHEHLDGGTHENKQFIRNEFGPFLKKCGKEADVVLFVVIAHTGKDLHPEIKRLSTHLGKKIDLKTLELFNDFDDNSHRLLDPHMTLRDLPQPPYYYDPDDMAPFSHE